MVAIFSRADELTDAASPPFHTDNATEDIIYAETHNVFNYSHMETSFPRNIWVFIAFIYIMGLTEFCHATKTSVTNEGCVRLRGLWTSCAGISITTPMKFADPYR